MNTEKTAAIGARLGARKWQQLWYTGKLSISDHKSKYWVLLNVHKGLCESAYHSLKSEGVDCEAHHDNPHISVLRPEEVETVKKKYGVNWHGAVQPGKQFRFRIVRMVSVIPVGWPEMDRVWFLEVESPELQKYRDELGFPYLPKHPERGHDMRFHITFATHRNTIKKAEELLIEKRAAAEVGVGLESKPQGNEGAGLLKTFEKMELDPHVTTSTLGAEFKNAGVPMLLRTSQKLLNIQKGEEDVDDRDSLAFQTLHSPEDFFAERIHKDAGQIAKKLLWKSTLRGNLKHVPTAALTPQMRSVLLKSGLGQALQEINPLDVYDQHLRVLRLGEGGMSGDAVPSESRDVQPSHFGYIDPIRSPESASIGVDARVAHGAVKGSDGKFYTSMLNARTGKSELIPAEHAARSVIAFPGEMEKGEKKVRAMDRSRQIVFADRDKVDYVLPSHNQMFSATSNMVPMVSGIKGGRLLMGAKYMVQALALKDPEAPLVQNVAEDGKSFHDLYADKAGAVFAKQDGVVAAITPHGITMRYADGTKEEHELYHNFPYNQKSYIHNTPTVKIGDTVAPGQVLARSNYTDAKGTLALGTNLRTAYMPWKTNYEDAIVISESAAKRLSSEHMYQHGLDVDNDDKEIGRKQFISIFPSKFTREQLGKIDEHGTVRPGTVVKHGDPLILALKRNKPTAVHKGHQPMYSDGAVVWDHVGDGVVTDVDQTKDGSWNVIVKAYSPMGEGDKLSGVFGDKGVISNIIPDEQMPHSADGKPMELLLNPLGIISRANPSQVFEALLGKVARKRGSAFKIPGFNKEKLIDIVARELKEAGLKDTEDLTDPHTGHKIPNVLTGERFMMKLHHMAEDKNVGRDVGSYTSEGLPARGGDLGSKRISGMEINSLISHGATAVLRDAQTVRGQRNDEYWKAFRMGLTPPSPKVPMVYQKFLSHLEGSGVHVKKDGNKLQLFALTDKDIDQMSSGAVQSGNTVTGDKLTPVKGGLFDEGVTGGHGGQKWSHVNLTEPIPNPVMEEPIKRLLGLTGKQYEEVISGKRDLHGETGGRAVKTALSKINVDGALDYYRGIIKDGAKSKRDNAVKVLGYLQALKKYDLKPEDWVLSKAPVLPPQFRPITMFRGMQMAADPNFLYRDLMLANKDLAELKGQVGESQLGEERLKLYNAFKAVTGLGDPVQPKTQEKGARGLLAHVFGASPKLGMFQRRVIGAPVDTVGRAVITPNPDLSMDQVGLPESKAWVIYRPFIMRRLIRQGMPAIDAARAVANQADVARKSMLDEMKARPVMINRAPTLHRYGFMAAWPILTKGNTLQIPPVLTPGFGADFDGDAMNYHVPVDDEAVQDAIHKMMPSKNLHSTRDFKVHYLPKNEFLLGLYLSSTAKNKKAPRVFATKQDVIRAFHRGEIHVGDPISVK
jgi:DNA-directed RNA polymerase beta subunit